jgi:hypothetical protein
MHQNGLLHHLGEMDATLGTHSKRRGKNFPPKETIYQSPHFKVKPSAAVVVAFPHQININI